MFKSAWNFSSQSMVLWILDEILAPVPRTACLSKIFVCNGIPPMASIQTAACISLFLFVCFGVDCAMNARACSVETSYINSKGSRLTTVQPPLRFETKSTHATCSHGFELRGEINHFQVEKRSGSLTFQLWRARVVSGLHLNLVSPWRAQLWYETPRAYGSLQVFLG